MHARVAILTLLFGGTAASGWTQPAAPAKPVPPDAVAVVGDVVITAGDLTELGGARLFQARSAQYGVERELLEEAIGRHLLEKEAAARGVGVEELRRLEIEAKVPAVTPAEQKEFYDANKQRFGALAEAEAMKRIEAGLRQQRLRERQGQLLRELRAKERVKVLLEPPRLEVSAGSNPSRGPADAPVTLIEFSDFQCPYCARVNPTLDRVRDTYGDKVRFVFRDFPLLQIHAEAAKAAEAAACADDQGKFWPMHDRLFANQAKLQLADLKQHAVELGLDSAAFDKCLDSGKHTDGWKQDVSEGSSYGVSGTPAVFINGRLLSGAQPFEAFARVIEDELERAGAAGAKPAAAQPN